MYKFSLVIPCYNVQNFLPNFFQKLENCQKIEEVEVIFVNDASTDSSFEILEKLCKGKQNYRLISNKENKGLGGAVNLGIANLSTKWFFRLDPDDEPLPNYVLEIIKVLKDDIALVRYKFYFLKKQQTKKPFFLERLYFKMAFGWSLGINVEKFGHPKYKEKFKMEDMEMFGRHYKKTGKEIFINEYLVNYRIDNPNSITKNLKNSFALKDWEQAFKTYKENTEIKGLRVWFYKINVSRKIKNLKKDI